MASDTSLVFNLLAKDQVSKTLGTVKGNIGKLGVAITGMVVGAGAGLLKVGSDFDASFDSIRVGTGATGSALRGLEEDFKAAFAQTPNDMAVVADAMTNLNTLTGATGETLQGLTVQVSEASRLLGEDGVANSEAFGKAMRQWQIPAEDGISHLDTLFKATQDYGVSLGGIIGHLTTYGPVLQNAGFSMEESAALFSQLEAGGISVSRVMPGLNKSFRDWAGEGKNLQGELEKTVKRIVDAESSAEALSIATETFGAEGAQRMTTAIRSGVVSLDDLSTALGGADGLIGETAEGTDDWAEKLAKLKNEGLVAVEPVATAVFDKLDEGVGVLRSVVEWGQRNTGTVKALGIALGSIAGIILAVNIGLKVYAGVQAVVRAATVAWTVVQWALNTAFLANPLTWIILGIIALVAVIVLIATKTTWFQDIWRVVWGAIKAAALAVWDWIKGTLWPGIQAAWDGIVAGVRAVWEGVKLYFGFWRGLLEAVIGWVIGVKDRIVSAFVTVVSFIKGLPARIRAAARGMFNGIRDAFRNAINWIISKWNGLSFTLPSATLFGKRVGGGTLSTPNIPHLAQGGIVTQPTLAVVGEAGPEAVIPLSRGAGAGAHFVFDFRGVRGVPQLEAFVEQFRQAIRTKPGFRAEVRSA